MCKRFRPVRVRRSKYPLLLLSFTTDIAFLCVDRPDITVMVDCMGVKHQVAFRAYTYSVQRSGFLVCLALWIQI